ncbi:MAG: TSUP family transporter [Acidimicrobiales bacterium]
MNWIIVALIGLGGGVVSGLFGIGGAVVVVPLLVLLAQLPQHTAQGTSLSALLVPVGLLGAMQYYKRGQVEVAYSAVIAAGMFVGAFVGAKLAGGLHEVLLRRLFGGLLLVLSLKLLVR